MHEIYTITVKVEICDDMKAKALEELRQLRVFILGGTGSQQGEKSVFNHAKVLKVDVTHEEGK